PRRGRPHVLLLRAGLPRPVRDAGERTRTSKGREAQRDLNPPRLPVPPHPRGRNSVTTRSGGSYGFCFLKLRSTSTCTSPSGPPAPAPDSWPDHAAFFRRPGGDHAHDALARDPHRLRGRRRPRLPRLRADLRARLTHRGGCPVNRLTPFL